MKRRNFIKGTLQALSIAIAAPVVAKVTDNKQIDTVLHFDPPLKVPALSESAIREYGPNYYLSPMKSITRAEAEVMWPADQWSDEVAYTTRPRYEFNRIGAGSGD